MKQLTLQDLMEAGCHFGHQTKRWNPKMKPYVYGAKSGISIIDLTKTIRQISDACNFLQRNVMNGGKILFVGTKRQAQQIVKETAEATGMHFVCERWLGGTLTNNVTIRKSIARMQEIDKITTSETTTAKKKEIASLSRLGQKLHRDLDGIADMRRLPDIVFIVDVCHDEIAVKEARKLGIPTVAIVDTNGDPSAIDYPIAANDDAVKSIKVIIDTITEAIKDAAELYSKKAVEDKAKRDAERAANGGKDKDEEKPKSDRPARNDRGGSKRPPRSGGRKPASGGAPRAAKPAVPASMPIEDKDAAAEQEAAKKEAKPKKKAEKPAAKKDEAEKPAAEAKAE